MPIFVWKPSYEIGLPEVDMQHRKLVGMINELYDGMKEDHGQWTLHHVLDELLDYFPVHFKTEEELMEAHCYPGLEAHSLEHMKLTAKVLELQERRSRGEKLATPELFRFLCSWLTEHIQVNDKRFGDFLKKRKRLFSC